MSLAAKLSARFAVLVFGRVTLLVMSLAVMALLTRHLGPEGFGHYRVAVAYLGLVILLFDLGLSSIFVREISRTGADQAKIIANALSLRLLIALTGMAVAVAIVLLLPFDKSAQLGVIVGSGGYVAYSLHLLLFGLFQQRLKQQLIVIAELAGGGVLLAAVFLAIWLGAGPVWFVAALAFSYLSTLCFTVVYARRLVCLELRIDLGEWSRLVRAALPLAGLSTLTVIAFRADNVVIALLSGTEAAGLYGVPAKVFDSLMGIILLFIGLFVPLLGRTAYAAPRDFSAFFDHGLGLTCVGTIGVAIALNAIAPELIALLAGPEFAPAATALRVLSIVAVLHGLTLFLREAATALSLQRRLLPGYVTGLAIAVVGYAVLIPRYAGSGAAIALLLSETAVLAYALSVFSKATPVWRSLRVPMLASASGAGAGLALLATYQTGWGVVGRTGISLATYGTLLIMTTALRPADLLAVLRDVGGR